jgi:hypothetical protein
MIPYFEVGPFQIGGLRIYPFGVMMASTLLTCLVIAIRRAPGLISIRGLRCAGSSSLSRRESPELSLATGW